MAMKFRPVVRKRLQTNTTPPKTMREATGLNGATVTASEPVTMPDLKVVHDTIVRLKRNSFEAWNHYRDVVAPKYHEGSELAKRLAKTDSRKGSLYNAAFSQWLHNNKLHHEQPTGIGEKARGALLTIVECGIDVFDAWLTELEKKMPEERAALTYPPRILRIAKCKDRGIKKLLGIDPWPYEDDAVDDDTEAGDADPGDGADVEPINTSPNADLGEGADVESINTPPKAAPRPTRSRKRKSSGVFSSWPTTSLGTFSPRPGGCPARCHPARSSVGGRCLKLSPSSPTCSRPGRGWFTDGERGRLVGCDLEPNRGMLDGVPRLLELLCGEGRRNKADRQGEQALRWRG
jgi:hypothetical protein